MKLRCKLVEVEEQVVIEAVGVVEVNRDALQWEEEVMVECRTVKDEKGTRTRNVEVWLELMVVDAARCGVERGV